MPTKKPRINLTVEQEDYDVLKRIAAATGVSMSSLVGEYIQLALPTLKALADSLEAIQRANAGAKERFKSNLNDSFERVQVLQHFAESEILQMLESLDDKR